jgi:2-succinyl-5-enolpyruvyl-6-hydroxy-3-cyclohexene-1-carboxylate synthase
LALTIARNPMIRHWIHHDERASAFFALGVGKESGFPAAVVTTSGTAAAELFAAVIEARYGRVPLLLLTADRPPELRGTGANQTIDQVALYGDNVKLFHDLAIETDHDEAGHLAGRALDACLSSPPGPVHLNFPFRDPLVPGPSEVELPPLALADRACPDSAALDSIVTAVSGRKALWVAGPDHQGRFGSAIRTLARASGQPVLADPLSNARHGENVLSAGDALALAGILDRFEPEVVVRLGPAPVSKALNLWLERRTFEYIICDSGGWRHPAGRGRVHRLEPWWTALNLAERTWQPPPTGWLLEWTSADSTARDAVTEALEAEPFPNEPGVMQAALHAADLWVASSMPVRDLDLVLGRSGPARILANRGASGIDGFLSSVMGAAAASGRPNLGVTGDLSFLHDVSALATAARYRLPVTFLVINNDGGGIFELLPQRDLPEFEELFATPHGLDLGTISVSFGVDHHVAATEAELEELLALQPGSPRVVEVKTDRSQIGAVRERLIEQVRKAFT